MTSPTLPAWQKTGSVEHSDCRIFTVEKERWEHPGGAKKGDFFVLHCPGWVNILARTTRGTLILVRQFRFGTRDFSLEIPGGMMEPGEEPVTTAVRELLEETGYAGVNARLLGAVHPNPAIQNNQCHLVLIDEVEKVAEVSWDGNEEMEILEMTVEDAVKAALAGEITHALVLNALFFLQNLSAGKA